MSIRARHNEFPVNISGPGVMCAAASKALINARADQGVLADLGGVVTIFLKCFLGHTRICHGGC